MGIGDQIMATGEAKRLQLAGETRPILFVNAAGKIQRSEIFNHNPRITTDASRPHRLVKNGGGCRPYIAEKTAQRWIWQLYQPIPGEFYFTDAERSGWPDYARDFVLIEPHVKPNTHRNKDYGWSKWLDFIEHYRRVGRAPLMQIGPYDARRLPGIKFLSTPSIRMAAAALSGARAIVTTDGALHHAAAAVGTRAVVLWSEFTAPEFLGYPGQINIRHAANACGRRVDCNTCRQSMERITPKEITEAVHRALDSP